MRCNVAPAMRRADAMSATATITRPSLPHFALSPAYATVPLELVPLAPLTGTPFTMIAAPPLPLPSGRPMAPPPRLPPFPGLPFPGLPPPKFPDEARQGPELIETQPAAALRLAPAFAAASLRAAARL